MDSEGETNLLEFRRTSLGTTGAGVLDPPGLLLQSSQKYVGLFTQ